MSIEELLPLMDKLEEQRKQRDKEWAEKHPIQPMKFTQTEPQFTK